MSVHSVVVAFGALLPSLGVAFLFYVVIKAMLVGDRRERLAHSKWEADQVISTSPSPAQQSGQSNNAGGLDSAL